MTDAPDLRPILILGPTAGGKSELAVALAEALGGEVIGADSMQVYWHMDAGTAKPSLNLRRRAPHHLIDIIEPTERFTVANWLESADRLIGTLSSDGVRPIVVGGTNLYIRALLEGLFAGPPRNEAFRAKLSEIAAGQLHRDLRAVDPDAAERIAPKDRKRIVRALEVFAATGKPISRWQAQWQNGPRVDGESEIPYRHNPILIALGWDTSIINGRINLRVKAMFNPASVSSELAADLCPGGESLPDEVKRLEGADMLGTQARQALGYKQVLEHLSGAISLDEAFEKTKILTRRFAKSQRTWLRRFAGIHWLNATDKASAKLFDESLLIVKSCK